LTKKLGGRTRGYAIQTGGQNRRGRRKNQELQNEEYGTREKEKRDAPEEKKGGPGGAIFSGLFLGNGAAGTTNKRRKKGDLKRHPPVIFKGGEKRAMPLFGAHGKRKWGKRGKEGSAGEARS